MTRASMGDIQRADPVLRRRALWLLIAGIVMGGVVIAGFEHYRPWLQRWLVSEPAYFKHRLLLVTTILIAATSIPLVAASAYVWRRALRARVARRMPPPGERVIRDTPVLVGEAALRQARIQQRIAVALSICAIALAMLLWRMAALIANQGH